MNAVTTTVRITFLKIFRRIDNNKQPLLWLSAIILLLLYPYLFWDKFVLILTNPAAILESKRNFFVLVGGTLVALSVLIALKAMCSYLLTFIYWLLSKKISKNMDEVVQHTDAAKEDMEEDELDREKLVDNIVGILKQEHDSTFTIHIDGAWGEGKTTVLNFVKKEIRKNDDYLIFNFNPWSFSTEKSIIKGFFEELLKQHSFLSTEAKNLEEALTLNSKSIFGISLPQSPVSIKKIKEKLKDKLIQRQQKLVIFIDDIDRLQKDKILETLKIVGELQFSGAKNIIFVLSFDYTVVKNLLKKEFESDKDYLEKIRNLSFKLVNHQEKVDAFFQKEITKSLSQASVRPDSIKVIWEEYKKVANLSEYILFPADALCAWRFSTVRNVKRFLNSFLPSFKQVAFDVNPADFLRLHIMKLFFPKVYEDILKNQRIYLAWNYSDFRSQRGYEDQASKENCKKHILALLENEVEKDFVLKNLMQLFPGVDRIFGGNPPHDLTSYALKDQRIGTRKKFPYYFLEDVPEGDVSDMIVFGLLLNWSKLDEKAKKNIASLGKNREFLQAIELHIDKVPKKDLKEFIYDCALLLPQSDGSHNNNYSNCCRMIFEAMDELFPTSIDREESDKLRLKLYKEIIDLSDNFEFLRYLIYLYQEAKSYNEFDRDACVKKLRKMFEQKIRKEVIKKNRNLFKEFDDPYDVVKVMRFLLKIPKRTIDKYLFNLFQQEDNYKYFIQFLAVESHNKAGYYKSLKERYSLKKSMEFAKALLKKKEIKPKDKKKLNNFIDFVIEQSNAKNNT